jgi:hydrogenase maturation protein HypF
MAASAASEAPVQILDGEPASEGRRIVVRGVVQGVGFRPWVYRLARDAGLTGRVRNDAAGVTIEAFGGPPALAEFTARLRAPGPAAASIAEFEDQAIPFEALPGFAIEPSHGAGAARVSVPPDLATCSECLLELFDSGNRRYRYPFTNCTSCGPRFTIVRDTPYDRPATTMAVFRLCTACRDEYESPADRRFHAEPNACPACGPRLAAWSPEGEPLEWSDPIRGAARALKAGLIVALKGVGGYHLACDATSSEAVARLRERKRREQRPFAVMVHDLDAARALAKLGEVEERLLSCRARPIVLVTRRPRAELAPEVAPGLPLLGLLLPYSPLHDLLMGELDRPIVMTSGNLSDEPLVFEDAEAVTRLGAIADVMIVHNRPIANRCDDSVARVIAGRPTILRRARGFVPRPLRLARRLARPVLGCGGQLKNTFCLGIGDLAHLGPHVGDLENERACRDFERQVERMTRFLRATPEVVAHDLHPQYFTTTWAESFGAPQCVPVQHHHAHVASAMAEHGLSGPVLGVAYDGTGYGSDGSAWGGELLFAELARFERVATFRAIPLAGGDQAIREVWRIALALLEDAYNGDPPLDALSLFKELPKARVAAIRRMLAGGVNAPLAHGVGRYFDGLGSLVLARPHAAHEAQVALEWNMAADPSELGCYAYEIDSTGQPWQIDLRPTIRHAAEHAIAGRSAGEISARFHNTLVAATAEAIQLAVGRFGRLPVVLTGGCFQNPLLAEGVLGALPELDVRLHREVPAGDGGLSLGQVVVADAVSRRD